MRDPGTPAGTVRGEQTVTWTTESLARQRALRAAVLIDAIRCLVGAAGTRGGRAQQSALRWILSRDDRAPFSFHNVCEALGLDPVRLRRSLLEPALVPRIVLEGEGLGAPSGRLPLRHPRRDRAHHIVLVGGRAS